MTVSPLVASLLLTLTFFVMSATFPSSLFVFSEWLSRHPWLPKVMFVCYRQCPGLISFNSAVWSFSPATSSFWLVACLRGISRVGFSVNVGEVLKCLPLVGLSTIRRHTGCIVLLLALWPVLPKWKVIWDRAAKNVLELMYSRLAYDTFVTQGNWYCHAIVWKDSLAGFLSHLAALFLVFRGRTIAPSR